MRDQYVQGGEGFVLVYAINSRDSFDEIANFREMILRAKDSDNFPILLVGNKCDLEKEREVSLQEGKDLAKSFGIPFLETSAMNRINIQESFFQIVREIRKHNTVSEKTSKKKFKKMNKCSIL